MFVTAAPSHVPAWQTVPMTYLRQAPCPSHVPSLPQLSTLVLGHVEAERGVRPAGTNEQVPIEPGTSHRLHVSPHALSQQTPSTQNPDWQSALQPHASPLTARAPPSAQTGFTPGPLPAVPPRSLLPATSFFPLPLPSPPPSVEELPPLQPSCATAQRAASETATFRARTK
jgi:hypothetical protein